MRRTALLWVAVAAITLVLSCSKTGDRKPPTSEQPGARPGAVGAGGAGANVKSDGDFARDVALKNMAEIELSRMALVKTTNRDIRSFAQMMIDDHSAAADKLRSVVSEQAIDWPAHLDDKHRETADELAEKQGGDFDREYLKAMVEGHQDLTAKLESRLDVQSLADWKTAAAGRTQSRALPEPNVALRDVEVRPDKSNNEITMKINQWAADTYPVAEKHLDTARTLENPTKKPLSTESSRDRR
jgi:putative membrane protein